MNTGSAAAKLGLEASQYTLTDEQLDASGRATNTECTSVHAELGMNHDWPAAQNGATSVQKQALQIGPDCFGMPPNKRLVKMLGLFK